MATALVLPEEAVSGSDAVTFPGFPGIWTAGQPIEIAAFVREGAFGSEEEMLGRVEELGLPLELVQVDKRSAPLPERANHVASSLQAVEAADEALAEKTIPQLDAYAAEHGIADYPKSGLKAEKIAAIEAGLSLAEREELGAEALADDDSEDES